MSFLWKKLRIVRCFNKGLIGQQRPRPCTTFASATSSLGTAMWPHLSGRVQAHRRKKTTSPCQANRRKQARDSDPGHPAGARHRATPTHRPAGPSLDEWSEPLFVWCWPAMLLSYPSFFTCSCCSSYLIALRSNVCAYKACLICCIFINNELIALM